MGGAKQPCNDFTVTLHRRVIRLYQDVTRPGSVARASASSVDDSDIEAADVRTTLGSSLSVLKASRLLHHLRILLPVSLGELTQLKSQVLFNVDWLLTRLTSTSVSQVIADVLSVHCLCRRLGVTSTSYDDVSVLLELLQLSSRALAILGSTFERPWPED